MLQFSTSDAEQWIHVTHMAHKCWEVEAEAESWGRSVSNCNHCLSKLIDSYLILNYYQNVNKKDTTRNSEATIS